MEFKDIENKTIKKITKRCHSQFDDCGYLDIEFTDGTKVCIVGGYDEIWSGMSVNEYPTTIRIKEYGYEEKSRYYR